MPTVCQVPDFQCWTQRVFFSSDTPRPSLRALLLSLCRVTGGDGSARKRVTSVSRRVNIGQIACGLDLSSETADVMSTTTRVFSIEQLCMPFPSLGGLPTDRVGGSSSSLLCDVFLYPSQINLRSQKNSEFDAREKISAP
jgi:hypothetical protein